MKRLFPALIAGVVLAGCTGMHRIESNAGAPSNDESFVVLGVNDDHYHVVIQRGSIDEHGAFVRSEMSLGSLGGSPKDGYLVGRVNSGDVVAITAVSYHNDPKSLLSNGSFHACGGVKTMVFKVPSGKVAYLGNVNYRIAGNQLNIEYANDLKAAQRYIDSSFPDLKGRAEFIKTDFAPINKRCMTSGTTYIPIYIPRSR